MGMGKVTIYIIMAVSFFFQIAWEKFHSISLMLLTKNNKKHYISSGLEEKWRGRCNDS